MSLSVLINNRKQWRKKKRKKNIRKHKKGLHFACTKRERDQEGETERVHLHKHIN